MNAIFAGLSLVCLLIFFLVILIVQLKNTFNNFDKQSEDK